MTLLQSFNNVDELNSYFINTLNSSHMIHLTADNIHNYQQNYPTIDQSHVNHILNNETSSYYFYNSSKTNYRKVVHSKVPASLYARFYKALKAHNYIVDANAIFVLINYHQPFAQSFLDQLSVNINFSQKTFSQIADQFDDLISDNQFYISYINSLEQKYLDLLIENQSLKNQINNAKLSTWY